MKEISAEQFTAAINRVAATEDGKIVLACLKMYVNFDGDITASDAQGTYANSVLRRAYLYLRAAIKPEYLKEIEFNYRRKATHERTDRITDKPSERKQPATASRRKRAAG